jgi:hypothetical protein
MKLRLILVLTACLLLPACGDEPTVEQQVIAAILEMEEHVENAHRGEFMDMITEDFTAQDGTLGRTEFRQFMFLQWNQNQRLYAQLFPIKVRELPFGGATAEFRALITGGSGFLPERGEMYDIETTWKEVDGQWLMASANWQGVQSGQN